MSKLSKMLKKRYMVWVGVILIVLLTTISVYAVKLIISLNSPTSFPVDI